MAEYIERETLKGIFDDSLISRAVKGIIDYCPTADVVPRAEYEKLHASCTELTRNLHDAKAEVEKIFAEIEYLIWQYDTRPANELKEEIAELKKKYTEEGK